jgi:hypothetical protein
MAIWRLVGCWINKPTSAQAQASACGPTYTHTHTHTHTQMCKTYCFSTVTVVSCTRLSAALHVHYLSCYTTSLLNAVKCLKFVIIYTV